MATIDARGVRAVVHVARSDSRRGAPPARDADPALDAWGALITTTSRRGTSAPTRYVRVLTANFAKHPRQERRSSEAVIDPGARTGAAT